MTTKSPSERLAEIRTEKERLLREEQELLAQTKAAALKETRSLIQQYGFTAAQLGFGGGEGSTHKPGKVPPKYRNPANPDETWTGRGKQPKWVQNWIAAGKKLEDITVK